MRSTAKKLAVVLAAAVFLSTAAMSVHAKDGPAPKDTAEYQKKAPRKPLSPEQRERLDAMIRESQEKLQPLQEQMMAKNLELQALSRNPNTDRATVTKLSEEIAALHTKMQKEHLALRERVGKELGLSARAAYMNGPGYGNSPNCGMTGCPMFPPAGYPMMMHGYGAGHMGPLAPGNWTQLPPKNVPQTK